MAIKRRRLPLTVRLKLLERSGSACSLCSTLLAGFDIHHIQYVSLGGGDEEGNLAVLCPNCHRNLAHGLYASAEGRILLAAAARRWTETVAVASQALQSDINPTRASIALCSDATRGSVLSSGAYGLMKTSASVLLERLDSIGSPDPCLRLSLLSVVASMAYYTHRGIGRAGAQLASELAQFDKSHELQGARNEARLALSRLYMISRRHDDELRVLEGFEAEHATAYQKNDWSFRRVSLERYMGASLSRLDAIPKPGSGEDTPTRMLRASVRGELGKAATVESREIAVSQLIAAFEDSYRAVHRRGMVMTALRLADLYVQSGDVRNGALWWAVANYGGGVGALPELGLYEVQAALRMTFGPDYLSQAGIEIFSGSRILKLLQLDLEPGQEV